jgi:ketosteroid isomerase-like protein
MSDENVDVVRGIYEQWGKGNFRAGVELYEPDAILVLAEGFPEVGSYAGLDGIAEYMRTFLDPWEQVTIEAEELLAAGESVVAAVLQRGTGRGSGASAEFRYFQVWTFRGGRVIRIESVRDRSAAFEAAGLSE